MDWTARVILAVCTAALGVGMVLVVLKSRPTPAAAPVPAAGVSLPDSAQVAYAEAQKTVMKNLPASATAKFSDYRTDHNTGAAEIGHGIWEAWGKIDDPDATGADVHADWHVAWDRRTGRVIYWKIGSRETGNYAEALGASKAYPAGTDASD